MQPQRSLRTKLCMALSAQTIEREPRIQPKFTRPFSLLKGWVWGREYIMVIAHAHYYGNTEKLQSDWSLQDLGACTTRCTQSYQTLFLSEVEGCGFRDRYYSYMLSVTPPPPPPPPRNQIVPPINAL